MGLRRVASALLAARLSATGSAGAEEGWFPFELKDGAITFQVSIAGVDGTVLVAYPREGKRLRLGRASAHPPTGSHIKRGVEVDGVLGYEILRHFMITIDYELNRLRVAPSRRLPPARDRAPANGEAAPSN